MKRILRYQRHIDYRSYYREDGLWDIEAKLTDQKGFDFSRHDQKIISAGIPYHEIHAILTIDDQAIIHDLVIRYIHHPFSICTQVIDKYQCLKGESIDFAWPRLLRSKVGGKCGCSHLNDLLKGMLTAIFQTLHYNPHPSSYHKVASLDLVKNTCHAWREGSPVYKDYYSGE